MKYICIWLIRFYQKYISPQKKKPCCRFYPSCSSYALQAFRLRGFFVGMILTVSRILRCQPFCRGGYDPVPLRRLTHPKNSRGEKIFYTLPENNRFVFTYYLPQDNDSQVQKIHERTI